MAGQMNKTKKQTHKQTKKELVNGSLIKTVEERLEGDEQDKELQKIEADIKNRRVGGGMDGGTDRQDKELYTVEADIKTDEPGG